MPVRYTAINNESLKYINIENNNYRNMHNIICQRRNRALSSKENHPTFKKETLYICSTRHLMALLNNEYLYQKL